MIMGGMPCAAGITPAFEQDLICNFHFQGPARGMQSNVRSCARSLGETIGKAIQPSSKAMCRPKPYAISFSFTFINAGDPDEIPTVHDSAWHPSILDSKGLQIAMIGAAS